jgi:adenylate cyclase, class 2
VGIERELKLPVRDPVLVRAVLVRSGAAPQGRVFEENLILDAPERRLRAAGCGLRLRHEWPLPAAATNHGRPAGSGTVRLTFKGPRAPGALKQREELETAVADGVVLQELLARLGFRPVIAYEKRRETWTLRGCELVLDEIPRLGWWLEIEGPDEPTIRAVQRALGLEQLAPETRSYVELADVHGTPDAAGVHRLAFE